MNNVVVSRVKFYRNLKDYKFTQKLEKEKKNEVKEKIVQTFLEKISAEKVDDFTFKKQDENISLTYDLLKNEHFCLTGESLGLNKETYLKSKEQIDMLSNLIPLSYSDDYGFLMSNLTLLGSGLVLEADFDLVGIKKYGKIGQVKQNIEKLGYNLTEKFNNIYTLSTGCNLGYTTDEVYDDFSKMASKLQELELESEKLLFATNSDLITDRAMRAKAILNSAYILNYDELNSFVGDLRMGTNLNCVKIKVDVLNSLENLVILNKKEIVSQSELKDLATKVKSILKGE